jgi:hypothetical protein
MRRWAVPAVVVTGILISARAATGDGIHIGHFSQQVSPGHARIGAKVRVTSRRPSRAGRPGQPLRIVPVSRGESAPAPGLPVLPSSSPRLRDRTPAGSGSRWIRVRGGRRCIYVPGGPGPCFDVAPGGRRRPAGPALDPARIAASMAQRLPLVAGHIEASPLAQHAGLTGAESWFWLSPAPATREVSVTLGGEQVTVTAAVDGVMWDFGDRRTLRAGPGVPYRAGDPPPSSVRHSYETRCLPGDPGTDPYVLSTCGPRGYTVTAELAWKISFDASGPVSESGVLPSRTTGTSLDYPVSEARGFLIAGGGT